MPVGFDKMRDPRSGSATGLGTNALILLGANAYVLASQAAILVSVSITLGATAVGSYSLALAIAAPLQLLSNLRLRALAASDTGRKFSDVHYLALTSATSAIAFAMTSVLIVLLPLNNAMTTIAIVVAGGKGADSLPDVCHGLLHRRNMFRLSSFLTALRASITAGSVILAVTMGLGLLAAVTIGAILSAILALTLECPIVLRWRRDDRGGSCRTDLESMIALGSAGFPLGASSFISSLSSNVPKYVLSIVAGPAALGVYSVLAYGTLALGPAVNAVCGALLPDLGARLELGDIDAFRQLLRRLALVCLAPVIPLSAAAGWMGGQALPVILGAAYEDQGATIVLLTGGTLFACAATILSQGLVVFRAGRAQLIVTFATFGFFSSLTWPAVAYAGVQGAAAAYTAAMMAQLLLTVRLLNRELARCSLGSAEAHRRLALLARTEDAL